VSESEQGWSHVMTSMWRRSRLSARAEHRGHEPAIERLSNGSPRSAFVAARLIRPECKYAEGRAGPARSWRTTARPALVSDDHQGECTEGTGLAASRAALRSHTLTP
jgi:hypothetical protein